MEIKIHSGCQAAPGELVLSLQNLNIYYHEGVNALYVSRISNSDRERLFEIHEPSMADLFRILSRIEGDDLDLSKFNKSNDSND